MSTKIRIKLPIKRQQESSASISSVDVSDDEGAAAPRAAAPANGLGGASQSASAIPEMYRHLKDLTEQEVRLLQKFARTKRVVLKVDSKPLSLAAQKAQLERKRRERSDRDRMSVKRPRLHTDSNDPDRHHSRVPGTLPPPSSQNVVVPAPPPPAAVFGGGQFAHRPSLSDLSPTGGPGAPTAAEELDSSKYLLATDWHTRDHKEPLILELPNLTFTGGIDKPNGGNTIIITGTMPNSSERFCINIAPSPDFNESDPNTTVLYHFNPRVGWGKRCILQNSFMQKTWGKADKSIHDMPIEQGKEFELRIHVMPNEFLVYLDGKHLSTFRNRADARYLKTGNSLYLIVPVIEAHFGDNEDVIISKVWWGIQHPGSRSPASAAGGVPGAAPPVPFGAPGQRPPSSNSSAAGDSQSGGGGRHRNHGRDRDYNRDHHRDNYRDRDRDRHHGRGGGPAGGRDGHHHSRHTPSQPRYEERVLHVAGLPLDARSAYNEVLRLFENYGIEKDERTGNPRIHIIDGKGFGFVTLKAAASSDEATKYLNGVPATAGGTLSVSRARKKSNNSRR